MIRFFIPSGRCPAARSALPAAPTALSVSDVGADRVTLHWTDASTDESGFSVERADASEFGGPLDVRGVTVGRHKVMRASSAAIPNAIAALLIHLRDMTNRLPHAYFGWTEGSPIVFVFRFVFLGEGDVAPVTHEVLRKTIADRNQRPIVHVA